MKTIILFLIAVTLAGAVACNKSDDILSNTGDLVTVGTWHVSQFTDSGNDETTDFAGYVFTFSNGEVTATKNGITKTGTWSINSSSNKFNIDLGPKDDTNKPLGELTDDWKILSSNSNQIKLGDDNAASNEFLTFTKN